VSHTSTGTNWGFQATAIDDATRSAAGNMSAADGTTLSDRFENGREYTNHSAPTTGNWTFNWTAPATNVGTVTFYASGVRVTGANNALPGDDRVYTASTSLTASTPGTLQFSSATFNQAENGGTATITVTRSGGSAGAASVQYSNQVGGTATGGVGCTAGVDYGHGTNTLNWADGDASSKSFIVTICDDNIFEGNETVNYSLGNATGATLGSPSTAILTINDNETQPTININDVSLSEGNSGTTNFNFNVSLSNPTTQTVTVNYATANGTATAGSDYQSITSTQLSFSAGQTGKTVTVVVNGDPTFEANETFFVNLSSAANAAIADNQGLGTIQNDDSAPQPGTLQFSSATFNAGENGAITTITVTRTGGGAGAASVQFSNPAGGTATGGASCAPGVDYTPPSGSTLNWSDGDTSVKSFTVTLCDDDLFEGNEIVNLLLSNATGATLGSPTSATLTINEDETPPAIRINDVSLIEGNSGTTNFTFTVSLSNASAQSVDLKFATANGTATAGSDYQARALSQMTFTAGQISQSITVAVIGDSTLEPNETFFVNLSDVSGAAVADSQGLGTIQNDDAPAQAGTLQFSLATYNQNEGGGTAIITVTRSGGSAGAASVQFSNPAGGTASGGAGCSAGVDYVTPSGPLNWADGDAASKTFFVTICDDSVSEANETVNLLLSNATGSALGSQISATLTINDNEAALMIFTEEGTNRALAIDSVTQVRGPFRVQGLHNFSSDGHTRVMLFTTNLALNAGDVLTVNVQGILLPIENVGTVPGVNPASYIVVRLVDQLLPGDLAVVVTLRGVTSNTATITISP
jgi:ribosomal protein L35AE/L33A